MFPDVTVNNFGDIPASLNLDVFQRGKEYLTSVFKHKIYHKSILCRVSFIFEHIDTQMVMLKIF